MVQLPLTTLGQETRWAYSTTPPSPHGATMYVHHLGLCCILLREFLISNLTQLTKLVLLLSESSAAPDSRPESLAPPPASAAGDEDEAVDDVKDAGDGVTTVRGSESPTSTVHTDRLADVACWTHTHTHTHTFNDPLSRTTRVSRYQKGKNNLDFTRVRDSEWHWHQLGHMQVCTLLQTDNHASTSPLSFYRPDAVPAAQPTASKH